MSKKYFKIYPDISRNLELKIILNTFSDSLSPIDPPYQIWTWSRFFGISSKHFYTVAFKSIQLMLGKNNLGIVTINANFIVNKK